MTTPSHKPRALFLIPTDYDSLVQKGVTWILNTPDENGFLERVVSIHPYASHERTLALSPSHHIVEFNEKFLPFCRQSKWLRYPHHVFHFLRLLIQVVRIMKKERIDFVRAFDPFSTGPLGWCLTRLIQRPFCISIHADYDKRFELATQESPTFLGSRRLAQAIEVFILKRADAVLPIRDSLAEQVARKGIPRTRIHVIPHGIDLTPFREKTPGTIRALWGLPADVPILAFAGRLTRDNYVNDIVDLAHGLKNRKLDFHIVLVGDGPERPSLEDRVEREGLRRCITFTGFQPRDVVIALRKECALSLCLMGGFSLIEACAAGRPVVSYDVEWHSELVKTGETGRLVPEKDTAALTEAVATLLTHPAEAAQMGAAAQTLAFERHDIQKTSALKCRCYLDLLNR